MKKNINNELRESISCESAEAIQEMIYIFLAKQTELYNGAYSSSIPSETAKDLLESVTFTLETAMKQQSLGFKDLAVAGINAIFGQGQEIIKSKITQGRILLEKMKEYAPETDNVSYWDTYKGIRSFFKLYNPFFFAHQIPADIDYPLCVAVSEELKGIDYINEYLKRIYMENSIINLFDCTLCEKLLTACYIDHVNLPLNMCEPIVTNAVGLAMLDEDVFNLSVTPTMLDALEEIFSRMTESETNSEIRIAAEKLCKLLNVEMKSGQEYLTRTLLKLTPRIRACLESDSLSNVFINLN